MRRIVILAMVFSLAGVGPAPTSACALFNSKLAECESPRTQSRCEDMNMGESGTAITPTPDASCCLVSRAPVPELQYKSPKFSLVAAMAVISDPLGDFLRFERPLLTPIVQDPSPPLLQALLCTFLI